MCVPLNVPFYAACAPVLCHPGVGGGVDADVLEVAVEDRGRLDRVLLTAACRHKLVPLEPVPASVATVPSVPIVRITWLSLSATYLRDRGRIITQWHCHA